MNQCNTAIRNIQRTYILFAVLGIAYVVNMPSAIAQTWHLKLDNSLQISTANAGTPSVTAVRKFHPQTSKPMETQQMTSKKNIMSLAQAKTMLDYQQYKQVIQGMQQFTTAHPDNAQAWHILAQALEADHRPLEAKQATQRAQTLGGTTAQRWHVSLQLASFVDSNVVAAPRELTLAARDKGDIGGSVQLRLSGHLFDYEHGRTLVAFQYNDMLYQDFNSFAVRRLSGNIAQQLDFGKHHIQVSLDAEQATLGNANLYAGYYGKLATNIALTTASHLHLGIRMGKRNFSQAFSPFSAWRTYIDMALNTQQRTWDLTLKSTFAIENTQGYEEAYRLNRIAVKGNRQLFQPSSSQSIWLSSSINAERRYYLHRDTRPFLITPRTRLDRIYSLDGALTWRKKHTLWGSNIPENWFFKAGWMKNNSNFNRLTTISANDSRSWRRWWINLGVSWNY